MRFKRYMLVPRQQAETHRPPRREVELVDVVRVVGLILIAGAQRRWTIGEVIAAVVRMASKTDE